MTNPSFYICAFLIAIFGVGTFSGCASRRALRPTNGKPGDPTTDVLPSRSWYIESKPVGGNLPFSCSFVEFDERGDYLDFNQQKRSWEKIRELQKEKLVFVIYCHGWKNSSQSGNVVEFNRFLERLATSPEVTENHLRVHGLYLSWRGNTVWPYIDQDSASFKRMVDAFDAPIVDTSYSRRLQFFTPLWLIEQLSYWSRKGAAESKVSGIPIARTIFTAANAAKHFSRPDWTNRVFVIGHSFGALMLERSLGQACVGALTDEWKWKTSESTSNGLPSSTSSLPFDCILFVNSAAPSIHTKELADLLWAHRESQERAHVAGASAPLVISLTSSADWATRIAHRWANVLAPLYPSLQRNYTEGILQGTNLDVAVPQSYFYEHTPGHNPLLVDHWIVPETNSIPNVPNNDPREIMAANLNLNTTNAKVFFTSDHSKTAAKPLTWEIVDESAPPGWSQYSGHVPVHRGNYWIIRCDKHLIASHDAIWTPTAMELYAALYRAAEFQRKATPTE